MNKQTHCETAHTQEHRCDYHCVSQDEEQIKSSIAEVVQATKDFIEGKITRADREYVYDKHVAFIHSRDKEVREQERKRIVEELRLGRYGKKLGYTTYEVNTNDILKPEE